MSATNSKHKAQVLVFGHDLSSQTKKYLLDTYGEFKVFKIFFHTETPADIRRAVEGVMKTMVRMGVDMNPSSSINTLMVAPGMTVAGMLVADAWQSATDRTASLLYIIKDPVSGEYIPCPELPVINRQQFKSMIGRRYRARLFQGVELVQELPLAQAEEPTAV